MKSIAAVVALLILCRPGPAQTKADTQLSPSARIYEPKNMTPRRAVAVANFVQSVLGGSLSVSWSDVPRALVIRSTNPPDIDAAEAMLKRFDVPEPPEERAIYERPSPPPQLDCMIYLIRAWTVGGASATPLPADLQSAIGEMKRSFSYDHYSLWDLQMIHSGGGAGDFQGILPVEPGQAPHIYSLSYKSYAYSYVTKAMEIADFLFSVKKDGIESHIKTNVTIHEGQKLVLGKIRLMPSENADLFLVLATKKVGQNN